MIFGACGNTEHKDEATQTSYDRDSMSVTIPVDGPDSPVAIVDNRIIPVDDFGTVVDFSAEWCPPCQKLKPMFARFKQKYEGKLNFVAIDIDSFQNLASSYAITNIPTLVFISADGKELGRIVGLHSPEVIESELRTYFPDVM